MERPGAVVLTGVILVSGCFEDTQPMASTGTTGAASGDASTTFDSTTGTETGAVESTGLFETGTTWYDSTGWLDTDTTGSESTGAVPDEHYFEDDFERASGADLGNGWVEKNDSVFRLEDGRVRGTGDGPTGMAGTLAFRGDDLQRDLELSAEFAIEQFNILNEPALALRVQPASLDMPERLDAYVLVAGGEDPDNGGARLADSLCIQRQFIGFDTQTQWCSPMDPVGLEAGYVYRLTFSSEGIGEVVLEGRLERRDPRMQDGPWELIAEVSAVDNSDERLSTAGAYGLSGGTGAAEVAFYSYDNFTADLL